MANLLNDYIPILYANEALKILQNSLGFANRVHRGFDEERRTFDKGDTISIRRPSLFSVQDAPGTPDDLNTGKVSVTMDQWKTVKYELSDKELAYTDERAIAEHVGPAVYALANYIDNAGIDLTTQLAGSHEQAGATLAQDDLVDVRAKLFDNGVPMDGNVHFLLDGSAEADLLKLSAFTQHQGSGLEGQATQRTGSLGTKFGMDFFADQNAGRTYTEGTVAAGADQAGAVNNVAGYKTGESSIAVDGFTGSETIVPGDEITFANHDSRYTVSTTATMSTGAATITLSEPLREDVVDNEVITVTAVAKNDAIAAWHRDSMALAFAKLPDMANELGARVFSVQDPQTGLSIRSRIYYVGQSSKIEVAFDVLYGYSMLNRMMGCKVLR